MVCNRDLACVSQLTDGQNATVNSGQRVHIALSKQLPPTANIVQSSHHLAKQANTTLSWYAPNYIPSGAALPSGIKVEHLIAVTALERGEEEGAGEAGRGYPPLEDAYLLYLPPLWFSSANTSLEAHPMERIERKGSLTRAVGPRMVLRWITVRGHEHGHTHRKHCSRHDPFGLCIAG